MKYYVIYEVNLGVDEEEEKRIVCVRSTRELAQEVMDVLYKTDVDFNTYKIEVVNRDVSKEGI